MYYFYFSKSLILFHERFIRLVYFWIICLRTFNSKIFSCNENFYSQSSWINHFRCCNFDENHKINSHNMTRVGSTSKNSFSHKNYDVKLALNGWVQHLHKWNMGSGMPDFNFQNGCCKKSIYCKHTIIFIISKRKAYSLGHIKWACSLRGCLTHSR